MITLYGFGKIFAGVIGETRDLRIEWALEEMGLPYRVHGIDHTGGEHMTPAYTNISPFHRVPAIDDDGYTIAESGAVLLYLAEKYGKLLPKDFEARMQITQWCFAAVTTVEWAPLQILLIDKFGFDTAEKRASLVLELNRSLTVLERQLDGRNWIGGSELTIADILMVGVLREIRHSDLLGPYPRVKSYYERALARPAFERALDSYSKRLGVSPASIR